jgi:hypothetical protein
LEVEELAVDLKALDPTGEVDPGVLLIANQRKGKGTVICPDIRPEGPVERVIARKEVREVWRRLADQRKCHVALLATGLKATVRMAKMEGSASYTVTCKRTSRMCGSWSEAGEEGRRLYRRWVGRRVLQDINWGRNGRLTDPSLAPWGGLVRSNVRNRPSLSPGGRKGIRIEFLQSRAPLGTISS